MNVSPFRLTRESTLATVRARGNEALREWEDAWCGLPGAGLQSRSMEGMSTGLPVAQEWQRHLLDDGTPVSWRAAPELARELRWVLFGLDPASPGLDSDTASPIATAVVADALHALVTDLVEKITGRPALAAPAALPDPALLRPGSGAVVCTLETGIGSVCWLLPHEAVAACEAPVSAPASAGPVTPLPVALKATPVALTVELARTELTLGYLRTLAVGDVLTLSVKLDEPLRVAGPGDTTVCGALLGARDGARAVELVKTR